MTFDYANSVGFITLDVTITIFVWLAVFLTAGVLRAPEIVESNLAQVGRRIILGGFLIWACRFTYVLFKIGDLPVPPVTGIALLFVSLGTCVLCLCKLFPHVNEVDILETRKTLHNYLAEVERMQKFLHEREQETGRKEDRKT